MKKCITATRSLKTFEEGGATKEGDVLSCGWFWRRGGGGSWDKRGIGEWTFWGESIGNEGGVLPVRFRRKVDFDRALVALLVG